MNKLCPAVECKAPVSITCESEARVRVGGPWWRGKAMVTEGGDGLLLLKLYGVEGGMVV